MVDSIPGTLRRSTGGISILLQKYICICSQLGRTKGAPERSLLENSGPPRWSVNRSTAETAARHAGACLFGCATTAVVPEKWRWRTSRRWPNRVTSEFNNDLHFKEFLGWPKPLPGLCPNLAEIAPVNKACTNSKCFQKYWLDLLTVLIWVETRRIIYTRIPIKYRTT
jgi:hypothetical protein